MLPQSKEAIKLRTFRLKKEDTRLQAVLMSEQPDAWQHDDWVCLEEVWSCKALTVLWCRWVSLIEQNQSALEFNVRRLLPIPLDDLQGTKYRWRTNPKILTIFSWKKTSTAKINFRYQEQKTHNNWSKFLKFNQNKQTRKGLQCFSINRLVQGYNKTSNTV